MGQAGRETFNAARLDSDQQRGGMGGLEHGGRDQD